MTEYSRLKDEIRNAPMTWLPALLLEVIEACVHNKVFVSKEAMDRVIENQINRTKTPRTKARINTRIRKFGI